MPQFRNPADHPLIRKLQSSFELSDHERAAVLALPIQSVEIRANQDIAREGDRPGRSCVILRGITRTYKMTRDGKRQIMAFHMPGDMPDLQSLHLKVLDSSLGTVSACRIGFIPHDAIRDLCDSNSGLAAALWRTTLVDASIFREWVVNVGRRDGYQRIAHIMCEILVRMREVGLTDDHSCPMPISQTELADATGLSAVHANRVIQDLRADGLIVLKGGMFTALDWPALKAAAAFDPTYLHLGEGRASD
ncbi:Crp/Fnr family transcriptional regulator [Faunimonas sp. B44]|uniref:Crp/Fnr family transcriptional regulator n=1 Tax=Faunimonas sp. B44 TaxID=3461493 RepID=UPI004044B7A0